jgi:primosomal protein N' (replication factor Y)
MTDHPLSLGPRSYALVSLNRPLRQPYTYFIPESLTETLRVGSLVEVPLRNEHATGTVIDLIANPDFAPQKIKPIHRQLTPEYFIGPALIEFSQWIADYYCCSPGEALASVSMIGLNDVTIRQQRAYALADPPFWARQLPPGAPETADPANPPANLQTPACRPATLQQRRVILALLAAPRFALTAEELREKAAVSASVIQTLEQHGWLARQELELWRDDDYAPGADAESLSVPHTLTPAQQAVFTELTSTLSAAVYRAFLLHGVTGSGKTEIYLRLIAEALKLGRTAIVLVPEISLTPQVVDAFRQRLGPLVGVYHSKLTLGQKFDLWRRIHRNEIRVIIGARSAIFSALPALGVIIVDEEHETSYKQGEAPRYHARDVAVMRARRTNAVVVLGSATPSVESLHNAREGKYVRLRLPERIGPHAPPLMTLIDMRRYLSSAAERSGEHLISPPLREALRLRIEAGQQSVLLLNRRGYANHVLCLKCETALLCPHCDVPMTYHKQGNRLLCHWCGERQPLPRVCPKCGDGEVHTLGLGTQRIEEVLHQSFPTARILRIDVDSMRRRGAFQEAWQKITSHEVDIILGTQMIAKGLHLENVTLVGVISADFALFLPDFRAGERTWALLTQVAGRAGRGAVAGEVFVQTYMPHHYAIDLAARGAEEQFYERELQARRVLQFPPFARLVALIITGPDADLVRTQAEALYNCIRPLTFRPEFKTVRIFAATPAPLGKLEDQYRWRLLARAPHVRPLHEVLHLGLAEFAKLHKKSKIQLTIDIDPVDLL